MTFGTNRGFPVLDTYSDFCREFDGASMKRIGAKQLFVDDRGAYFSIVSYSTEMVRLHKEERVVELMTNTTYSLTTAGHLRGLMRWLPFDFVSDTVTLPGGQVPMHVGMKITFAGKVRDAGGAKVTKFRLVRDERWKRCQKFLKAYGQKAQAVRNLFRLTQNWEPTVYADWLSYRQKFEEAFQYVARGDAWSLEDFGLTLDKIKDIEECMISQEIAGKSAAHLVWKVIRKDLCTYKEVDATDEVFNDKVMEQKDVSEAA